MKKWKTSTTVLLIGVALFLVGMIQPEAYEKAKKSGYEVEAEIVKIKEKQDSDDGSTAYILYGNYEVDGKTYENVKLNTIYMDKYAVGDTIKVVVDPNNPGKPMFEGGIIITIGFVVMVVGIVMKVKEKKRSKAATQIPEEPKMKTFFCPHCGAEHFRNGKFCSQCGGEMRQRN